MRGGEGFGWGGVRRGGRWGGGGQSGCERKLKFLCKFKKKLGGGGGGWGGRGWVGLGGGSGWM